MTKTLKQFFSNEVYQPNTPDEKRFIDKHKVNKVADKNGNGDELFKASKIKVTPKRRGDYKPGEDTKVYEAVGASNAERKAAIKVRNNTGSENTADIAKNNFKFHGDKHNSDSQNAVKQHGKLTLAKKELKKQDPHEYRSDNSQKHFAKGDTQSDATKRSLRSKIKGDSAKSSYYSKNASLYNNASKLKNEEVKDFEKLNLTEDYNSQQFEYMKKAIKFANQISSYLTKLSTAKTDYGSPYYYDAKYMARQLEDISDNLENSLSSYKNAKQNKLKVY